MYLQVLLLLIVLGLIAGIIGVGNKILIVPAFIN